MDDDWEILVGGIPTPLKNMSSIRQLVGMMTFPIYGNNNPNVPNHQPVICVVVSFLTWILPFLLVAPLCSSHVFSSRLHKNPHPHPQPITHPSPYVTQVKESIGFPSLCSLILIGTTSVQHHPKSSAIHDYTI